MGAPGVPDTGRVSLPSTNEIRDTVGVCGGSLFVAADALGVEAGWLERRVEGSGVLTKAYAASFTRPCALRRSRPRIVRKPANLGHGIKIVPRVSKGRKVWWITHRRRDIAGPFGSHAGAVSHAEDKGLISARKKKAKPVPVTPPPPLKVRVRKKHRPPMDPSVKLSPAEAQRRAAAVDWNAVLRSVRKGEPMKTVAARLGLSYSTVQRRISRLGGAR